MRVTIGIVLAVVAIGGFIGLYLYGGKASAPPVAASHGPLGDAPAARQPDLTVGADDVGGARIDANLTRGTAGISTDRRNEDGEGIKGRLRLDSKGQAEGRVDYGMHF